jgi:hypothetical protein
VKATHFEHCYFYKIKENGIDVAEEYSKNHFFIGFYRKGGIANPFSALNKFSLTPIDPNKIESETCEV